VTVRATRDGAAHGLIVWFDAVLHDGVAFSNAPGQPPMIYGAGFLPFASEVDLRTGDSITVLIEASLIGTGYVWACDTTVHRNDLAKPVVSLHQSSFRGVPLSRTRLRRRSHVYQPALGVNGEVDLFVLQAMNGAALEEIARALLGRFPDRFKSEKEALTRVADLSEKYDATYPRS